MQACGLEKLSREWLRASDEVRSGEPHFTIAPLPISAKHFQRKSAVIREEKLARGERKLNGARDVALALRELDEHELMLGCHPPMPVSRRRKNIRGAAPSVPVVHSHLGEAPRGRVVELKPADVARCFAPGNHRENAVRAKHRVYRDATKVEGAGFAGVQIHPRRPFAPCDDELSLVPDRGADVERNADVAEVLSRERENLGLDGKLPSRFLDDEYAPRDDRVEIGPTLSEG